MKRRILAWALALAAAAALTGCGRDEAASGPEADGGEIEENPFDYEKPPEVLGSVSHSGAWPGREEGRALEYSGGELSVPYRASGDGTGKNVGFLLFIDGAPQPYKLDGEGEYSYMHTFSLREDNVQEEFTFDFVPVTGQAGETATFVVADIFNAEFEPDMVSSSGFGLYGGSVATVNYIHFAADPERTVEAEPLEALKAVTVTNELMTAEFIEENLGPDTGMTTGDGKTREDRLEESVFLFDTYDGQRELNGIDVTGKSTLHAAADICGIPGETYRISMFADNVPLSDGADCFWEVTLEKGKRARVEADIDLGMLTDDVTTFYITACAVGDWNGAGARGDELIKTGSLPIWSRDSVSSDKAPGGEESPAGVLDTPEAMDETVRAVYYGGGDRVLVRRTDGLIVCDMKSGEVLARGALPELSGAVYCPVEGGYCALGETQAGGSAELVAADAAGEKKTVCVFLSDTLEETDRVCLSDIAGEGKNILAAAVSPGGEYIAYSVMDEGVYLLKRGGGAELILDLEGRPGGLWIVTGLWFDGDSSRLIFADNSHYGSVGLDGGDFVCAGFDGFEPQGAVGCAGGKVFFNESFFVSSGAMAVAEVEGMTGVIYNHTPQEGRGDLHVSRDGEYFATTAFDGSLIVRVYGTQDDRLCLEYTVTDENADIFSAAPGVLILDDLKICILKLGGFSDVPARVLVLPME